MKEITECRNLKKCPWCKQHPRKLIDRKGECRIECVNYDCEMQPRTHWCKTEELAEKIWNSWGETE